MPKPGGGAIGGTGSHSEMFTLVVVGMGGLIVGFMAGLIIGMSM